LPKVWATEKNSPPALIRINSMIRRATRYNKKATTEPVPKSLWLV
jgi:hypothetical protein